MRICKRGFGPCVILLLCACGSPAEQFELGGFRYDIDGFEQWKLPKSLREISGLTVTDNGQVFAHADERGVVHQLDYNGGRLVRSFALGEGQGKPIKGDFEGIAAVDDALFMITSSGTLYEFRPGMDGSRVAFTPRPTQAEAICEVEGLTYHPQAQGLYIACKHVFGSRFSKDLLVLFYSLTRAELVPAKHLRIAAQDVAVAVAGLAPEATVNPSAVALARRTNTLLLLAAKQGLVLELGLDGTIVTVFSWPMERYHRQSEGLVQLMDGTLLVADEGKNKRGRLGVYRPQR